MDESEVQKIIMDSTEPSLGQNFEKMEKEFMILKGSIKKLILDIREQMNSAENPFSNIQMLQMPPPSPVIKEDPVELELPKKEDQPADGKDAKKPVEPAKQAEPQATKETKEKTMAQENKTGTGSMCPLAARAEATHGQCPLAASGNIEQSCPLARANGNNGIGYQTSYPYYHMQNYHAQHSQPPRERSPWGNPWEVPGSRGDAPYGGYPAYSGPGHVCAGCGRPVDPYYGAPYHGYWPVPEYPPQRREGRRGLAGYDTPQGPFWQPEREPRSFYYDHPEWEPAHYGHPYGQACEPGYGPRYDQQRRGRRPSGMAQREYYYPEDDYGYYYERPSPAYRRRAEYDYDYGYDYEYGYEPEYYRPAPRRRRVARMPEAAPRDYYEPVDEERTEPVQYRPVSRRRKPAHPPAPEYELEDDYEMTEPVPEIDHLPDQPEPEQDLIRIKKRGRVSRIIHEPIEHDMVMEQPNPKPRRSRPAKLRG